MDVEQHHVGNQGDPKMVEFVGLVQQAAAISG
jgi:hypothetical protein